MRLLSFLALPLTLSAQITGPLTINNPAEIRQQAQINAAAFAEQWVYAFGQLKVQPGINIQIVTSKDGHEITLDHIHRLTKTQNPATNEGSINANLLIATQRIDRRDYSIILDPRQIRFIRQVKAD